VLLRSIALFCFALPLLPQSLTVGAKGGLRLTGDVPPYGISDSKRYLVGPMIEFGLPFGLAFEADALYSRLGNTFRIPLIGNSADIRTVADSWQFPLLVKYRAPVSRLAPFLSAGIAPRHASGAVHTIHYGFLPGDITFHSQSWSAHDRAWVFAAGASFKTGRLRITPELRYLRWSIPHNPAPNDVAFYLQPPRNYELQFLLGISWSHKWH
jgi:hypothetical protein